MSLGTTAGQTGLEFRQGRRGEEEENGVERGVVGFDELDSLGIDVQNTSSRLIGHVLDSLDAGPISVPRELSVLDEFAPVDHLDKGGVGGEMVVDAVDLASTGRTGGVRDGESELGRMGGEQSVEEGRLARPRGTTDDKRLRTSEPGCQFRRIGISSRTCETHSIHNATKPC